jgi:nitrate reductase beta subunit
MRGKQLDDPVDRKLLDSVAMTEEDIEDLYQLLAISKYDDRYVVPPVHAEGSGALMAQHCSLDEPGGALDRGGSHDGRTDDGPPTLPGLTAPDGGSRFRDSDGQVRFNLLGWNGAGRAPGIFGDGDSR